MSITLLFVLLKSVCWLLDLHQVRKGGLLPVLAEIHIYVLVVAPDQGATCNASLCIQDIGNRMAVLLIFYRKNH